MDIRYCPVCNKCIQYKSLKTLKEAEAKKKLCKSCSKSGDKNPMKKEENKEKFRGDKNPAKRIEVRKKISENNPMLSLTHRIKQKESLNTKQIKKARSIFLKKNNPAFNKDSLEKRIRTYCSKLSTGETCIQGNSKGFYLAKSGVQEWYDGKFELSFMQYLDSKNLIWTKKHGIKIPYINIKGINSYYVPDFLIDKNIIVETKGYFKGKRDLLKIPAALGYCKDSHFNFIYLRSKKIKNQYVTNVEDKYSLIIGESYVIRAICSYGDNKSIT